MGQQQCERKRPDDGHPDHPPPADPVPDGTTEECADGHGAQKDEQDGLGLADLHPEPFDQEEGIVAFKGLDVDELAQQQGADDGERQDQSRA